MPDLARSFDDAAAAYERGRPRYSEEVIAAIARAGGGPRLLDVGAGTGRLSVPLLESGIDVVAVEPLDRMRAILARSIGGERALEGRAEALPLGDASVDGAVCADAWHWFAGRRAADELERVVRPGGGVVVCVSQPRWRGDEGPPWWREVGEVILPLWKAVDHPYFKGSRRPDGLEGHPGFEPIAVRNVAFVHHSDREGQMAHYASFSWVASLPPARRAEVLGSLEEILVRNGVEAVEIPYFAELWVTRRRPAPGLLAARPAAAS